jgi:hypothetical protein
MTRAMTMLGELETLSHEVGVSCDRCHRTVTFSVDELRRRYGGKAHPVDAVRRMRCTDCGGRSLTSTVRVR